MRTALGCLAVAICGALTIASTSVEQSPASVERGVRKRYAAVAFDYLVLFNPDSVVSVVDRIASGRGREFTNLWRTRQFECSWLRSITGRYVRAITIANFSPAMLQANAKSAGLTSLFDALVSTDVNHSYKPDPRAYQLGIERLKLRKRDIVFEYSDLVW